jgi:hypothetical protein
MNDGIWVCIGTLRVISWDMVGVIRVTLWHMVR